VRNGEPIESAQRGEGSRNAIGAQDVGLGLGFPAIPNSAQFSATGKTTAVAIGFPPAQKRTGRVLLLHETGRQFELAIPNVPEATFVTFAKIAQTQTKNLAVGDNRGNVLLYTFDETKLANNMNPITGDPVVLALGPPRAVTFVQYSADDKTLVAADSQTVKIWDLAANEKLLDTIKVAGNAKVAASSDNKTIFVSSGRTVTVYQVDATGKYASISTITAEKAIDEIALSGDNKWLAAARNGGVVQIFQLPNNLNFQAGAVMPRNSLMINNPITALAFSRDGNQLAVADTQQNVIKFTLTANGFESNGQFFLWQTGAMA